MDTGVLATEKTRCFHCGEPCNGEPIFTDGKPFCCNGCKAVYQILDDNELDTYYSLEKEPGTSFKTTAAPSRFDYLDDPALVAQLIDFKNEEFISATFHIPNIHCTSCIWLLENLYKLDEAITYCSANFLKRELSIRFRQDLTSLRNIIELLASIGYEPELSLENLTKKNKGSNPNRTLWLKLGVAGFAFGNIMLLSFPEYLSGSTLNSQGKFHLFFGLLNIILALPVLFYSSIDYLKSAWATVKQRGINLDVPISIGILALFVRSLYEICTGTGAGYMDSFTGLVFFLLIGRIIQTKTYQQLSFDRDYTSYLPISVTVIKKYGREQTMSIDQLKEQTEILIRNQELIPADSILLSENRFVDYSFITGEAAPIEVQQGDTLYAGGKVIGTSAKMRTIKEVSNSYLTKLWNDAAFDKRSTSTNVSSLANRISPHFTFAVLTIALNAGIIWWTVSTEMALMVFTSVLIIACPCALALATPFTLGSALNIISRNGLYIKGIEVVERLANASTIVFDKTGTLTKADEATLSFEGHSLCSYERQLIKSACKHSVHPLSQQIASHLKNLEEPALSIQQFNEISNKGIEAMVDGRQLLIGSSAFLKERSSDEPIQKPTPALGASFVHVAIEGTWKGWFAITHPYRSGIEELLTNFKIQFSTFLLSGDNDSQKDRYERFFAASHLRFNQTPQQKLDFIKALQKKDKQVIMVGDGLNDAGALQQSDFGIALTDNISSFTPACDAIMDGDSLKQLNTFIHFSKACTTIIKYSFGLSLIYNAVGLGFAIAGQLSPLVAAILMPLSSISIMIFTTVSTHLTAKKMGLITWK